MSADSEQARRHEHRAALSGAIQRLAVSMAQEIGADPGTLIEAMVVTTAMLSMDLAREGMRRESVIGAAQIMLEFSRSDAPWFSGEPLREH